MPQFVYLISFLIFRSQNKGCLSVSVEDLLSAAAEPPGAHESLNEQLERLSDAFDAVQRYLEQYSLDGHQSPIPEFNEDPEDGHSLASGFSGLRFVFPLMVATIVPSASVPTNFHRSVWSILQLQLQLQTVPLATLVIVPVSLPVTPTWIPLNILPVKLLIVFTQACSYNFRLKGVTCATFCSFYCSSIVALYCILFTFGLFTEY